MWTITYQDADEIAESDEAGNVRITDRATGRVHMRPPDAPPTNPPDVAPIPEYRAPAPEQYLPGLSPEELAVRFPGVPQDEATWMAFEQDLAAKGGPPAPVPAPAPMPSDHLGAPRQAPPAKPAGFGGLSLTPGADAAAMLRSGAASAKDAAGRLGFTERPTIGEIASPPYAAVKRAAGAIGAATVEVPRAFEQIAPVVKSAAYGVKDVLDTPLGERPKYGAAEAAANPIESAEPPPPPEDPAELFQPPAKSFEAEPGSANVAAAEPEQSRADILRSSIDQLMGEKPNYDIDADRWWKGLSGGHKALAILSAAMGGFAEGFNGTPNRALEVIQGRRAADIRSQEVAGQRGQDERSLKLRSLLDELGMLEVSASKQAAIDAKGTAAGKTLPAGEAAKLGGYIGALDGMEGVFKKWDDLGWTGFLQSVPGLRSLPTDGKRYQQGTLPPEVASLVQGISGQDATDRQYERFLAMYPNADDTREMGEAKKQALRIYVRGRYSAARDSFLRAGYDMSLYPALAKIQYRDGEFEDYISAHPEIAEEAIAMMDELGHASEPAAGVLASFQSDPDEEE